MTMEITPGYIPTKEDIEAYGKDACFAWPDHSGLYGLRLQPGAEARVETPVGGGFGDPGARPREQVEWDVSQGYISPEAATDCN